MSFGVDFDLAGLTFRASGVAGIYSDGFVMSVAVSASADAFVFSLSASGLLRINTVGVTRNGVDPGFKLQLTGSVTLLKLFSFNAGFTIEVGKTSAGDTQLRRGRLVHGCLRGPVVLRLRPVRIDLPQLRRRTSTSSLSGTDDARRQLHGHPRQLLAAMWSSARSRKTASSGTGCSSAARRASRCTSTSSCSRSASASASICRSPQTPGTRSTACRRWSSGSPSGSRCSARGTRAAPRSPSGSVTFPVVPYLAGNNVVYTTNTFRNDRAWTLDDRDLYVNVGARAGAREVSEERHRRDGLHRADRRRSPPTGSRRSRSPRSAIRAPTRTSSASTRPSATASTASSSIRACRCRSRSTAARATTRSCCRARDRAAA